MYIICLNDANAASISLSGGKGASLAKLSGMQDINVPDGFIITSEFFADFVLPAAKQAEGTCTKEAIANMRLPDEAIQLIASVYEQDLGAETLVAVRSSATAEDLPDASFAGQQDTFLNVSGIAEVIGAAIKCFASLYNERAISYRARTKIIEDDVSMAVVVQKMVEADAAGVMFTADPMTSDRFTIAIEAVCGLGDDLVSGRKSPATYSIRRFSTAAAARTGSAAARTGSAAARTAAAARTGSAAANASSANSGAAAGDYKTGNDGIAGKFDIIRKNQVEEVLSDKQILSLCEIGIKIEQYCGSPQDIEWALKDDVFYIVQSRDITTLYPLPPSPDGFKRCYASVGHMQVMTDVMLPLGMSFWGYMSDDIRMENVGGRIYMDITHNLSSMVGKLLLKQKFSNSDELMYDALQKVWSRKEYVKSIPKGQASKFAMPKTIMPAMLAGWRAYRKNDPAKIFVYEQRMEQSIKKAREALSGLSGRAAIEFIREDMKELMKDLLDPEGFGPLLITFYQTKSIDKAGKELLGRDNISVDICRWLNYNITSDMGHQVSRIAEVARDYPDLVSYLENAGENFDIEHLRGLDGGGGTGGNSEKAAGAAGDRVAGEFETFFQKYGMRCPGEIDITKPRFSEQPSKILPSIIADMKLPKSYTAQKAAQGKIDSDSAVDELIAAAKEKWGDRKAQKLEKKISFYRNFLGLRESPKYFWMKRYWEYKQVIIREAGRLVQAGTLRCVDDINYLSLDEIIDLYEGSFVPSYAKIDELAANYDRWATLAPPRLIFTDGEVAMGDYKSAVPQGALGGLAVSSGIAEGRARVVLDIKDIGRIEKGDILVTKFTDPSWTPAFMSIGGLITEVGGMATHGAVVTREYGLPCVVGVVNATHLIKDGANVRLNGDQGYVEFANLTTISAR